MLRRIGVRAGVRTGVRTGVGILGARQFVGVISVTIRRLNHSERYQKVLDDYFKQDHFRFLPGTEQANLEKLKQWIPLVYLRNRPLISIDVEAWEKNKQFITEIGFTTYDPRINPDLIYPVIKPHHILIKEHMKKTNGKFVANNKKFFIGGESYSLLMQSATKLMKQVIEKYIIENEAVLVGHDVLADVRWLQSLGINFPENIPTIDTLKLHQLTRTSGGTLRTMCRNLDVPHAYLHNAANDSYYTLLVAMKLCDPNTRITKQLDIFMDKKSAPKPKKVKNLLQLSDVSFISQLSEVKDIIPHI